jgi:hypothetical protein
VFCLRIYCFIVTLFYLFSAYSGWAGERHNSIAQLVESLFVVRSPFRV